MSEWKDIEIEQQLAEINRQVCVLRAKLQELEARRERLKASYSRPNVLTEMQTR